jgi:protein mago nashi
MRREDDTKWPQKNKDGRQELEIRLGSEHISFEVRLFMFDSLEWD